MQEPGLPCSSNGKESACNAGDLGSIPGSGGSPGGGTGNPLQYSCLENSMERGAWRATVHGVAKSQMTEHDSEQLGNKPLLKSRALFYKSHQMAFAFLLPSPSCSAVATPYMALAQDNTGEGNGNPLQDSCLENPTDKGAWHGVTRVGHDLVTKPTTTPRQHR